MDFVIPLHRANPILRATIESICLFYSPIHIYIITAEIEICKIQWNTWHIGKTQIHCIPEETFFLPITKTEIENLYVEIDEKSREFGWWYQQLIKLAAGIKIPNLSDPYMVWDSDLIPFIRWEIYPTAQYPHYRFAILQESARSEWNVEQYKQSIWHLIRMEAREPEPVCSLEKTADKVSLTNGTFVPHHFVFFTKKVLRGFFDHIESISGKPWIFSIMELSSTFWRFSEYKCIATYMTEKTPELLHYHPFYNYGYSGIRYRDSCVIVKEILDFAGTNTDVSYSTIVEFVKLHLSTIKTPPLDDTNFTISMRNEMKFRDQMPVYLQLEHV